MNRKIDVTIKLINRGVIVHFFDFVTNTSYLNPNG